MFYYAYDALRCFFGRNFFKNAISDPYYFAILIVNVAPDNGFKIVHDLRFALGNQNLSYGQVGFQGLEGKLFALRYKYVVLNS